MYGYLLRKFTCYHMRPCVKEIHLKSANRMLHGRSFPQARPTSSAPHFPAHRLKASRAQTIGCYQAHTTDRHLTVVYFMAMHARSFECRSATLVKPARLDRRRAVASLPCDTTAPGGNEYMSEVLARLSTIQIIRLCLEVHMHRVVLWCYYVLHLYIACKHIHIYSHHLDSKACIAVPSSILLLVDVRTSPAASSVSRSSTLQLP